MIATVFAIFVYLWFSWALYVLIMGIYRAHLDKRLNKVTILLSLPFIALGYILDVLANIFVASILFLELPKELYVTTRLQRYKKQNLGWRTQLSSWICINLLDVFDPTGSHC